MRIGLFADTYYPQINGVATSVFMLKENLEAKGHSVTVCTTTDPQSPEGETNVIRVPSVPFSVRRFGAPIDPRLRRRIKDMELELIHTHTEFPLGIFGRHIAHMLNVPLVHTMHTIYEDYTNYVNKLESLEPAARKAARKYTASFCNSADAVIVPTTKVRDLLITYGVTKDIAVIPTGIELGRFAAENCDADKIQAIREELGISGYKTLIYVGRISEEKNLSEVLQSLASYLPKHGDVRLVLIGDGPAQNGLKSLAAKLGIKDRVIFAGVRPWDEIGLYFRLGDIFVSASQSETQGLTYVEALASGVPVVAKYDRCLDDIIINGENGYVFTETAEFHGILDKALYNEQEKTRLSEGASKSSGKYSASNYADSVASLYSSVLKSG